MTVCNVFLQAVEGKTVRKYLGFMNELSIGWGGLLSDDQEVIGKPRYLIALRAATYQAPSIERVGLYRDDITGRTGRKK